MSTFLAAFAPHLGPMHGEGDAPPYLGVLLGVGIPVFVLGTLLVVFTLVRRAIQRQIAEARAQADREGLLLDSGPIWMTIRYRGFRSSNVLIGVGLRKTRAHAMLTRQRLLFVPGSRHYFTITRADLPRFTVLAEDGALRLHTDDPPNASGSIDYRLPVADPAAWVRALSEAGARAG